MKARPAAKPADGVLPKSRNFTISVETMAKMERITEAIGIPKERLALMLIRAKKRGLLDPPKSPAEPVVDQATDQTTERRAGDRRQAGG